MQRSKAQTLVVFKEAGAFRFAHFDDLAHALLMKMAEHFHAGFSKHHATDADKFAYQERFRAHFAAALRDENWSAFAKSRGSNGAALPYPSSPHGGAPDFTAIIAAVRAAVGREGREGRGRC